MIEVLILSFVQGVTEFIPVSSSSHLVILSEYLKFENRSLSIDVSLHIGSFFAVLTFFYKDILNFIKNKELIFKILISSIPVIIVGYILVQTNFINKIRNLEVIAWMTIIFGILLYMSDRLKLEKNISNDFGYKSALFIGISQILSLVPGVSRSGIVMTAARILKFKRTDSAKISFLLSIPTLGAVSIFGILNLIKENNFDFSLMNFFSIFLSFIFSYITIKYFLLYIQNFSLKAFVIYRLFIGFILLFIIYL